MTQGESKIKDLYAGKLDVLRIIVALTNFELNQLGNKYYVMNEWMN